MMPTQHYGRTPLPKDVRAPMWAIAPLWMAIIFSPFVAFWVNGRVDDSNWMPAYVTAGVSLLVLAVLHIRATANYLQLPVAVRAEYSLGKVYPALRQPHARKDRGFELGAKGAHLRVAKDGIRVTSAAWLRADFKRALEHARKVRAHGIDTAATQVFIPWGDIQEWEVHDDSDAPNYRLRFAKGAYLNLKRPTAPGDEVELLDSVRTTGQIAVRIFCDVPRA
ncbi:MAG: hypothetical protein HOP13_10450 [Alphaproteobacteria bacterium]|nr:hypothetical protein [Alphaproteobacteria bacterium]